jgi:antitoxin YefM
MTSWRLPMDPSHLQQGSSLLKVTISIAMSSGEQMSFADVKNRLSGVVERLEREHGRVVITKHSRPAAVVLNIEHLVSLEEALDILGNGALADDIGAFAAEFDASGGTSLTKAEALALITDR